MGEAKEHLRVKIANQSTLFEDGVIVIQSGDEMKPS